MLSPLGFSKIRLPPKVSDHVVNVSIAKRSWPTKVQLQNLRPLTVASSWQIQTHTAANFCDFQAYWIFIEGHNQFVSWCIDDGFKTGDYCQKRRDVFLLTTWSQDTLPSQKYITTLTQAKYRSVALLKNKKQSNVHGPQSDIWTSKTIDTYILITGHFISETKHFSVRHTGRNIADSIDDTVKRFDIVVYDSAANADLVKGISWGQ